VNNPTTCKKSDDVEAIILSINHDEKKSGGGLGVKQLWDDVAHDLQ